MEGDRGLTFIAVFKLTKAILLVAVGLGALAVVHPEIAGRARYWVAHLASGSDRRLTQTILAKVGGISPHRLEALGVGAFVLAGLYTVEAIGLWRRRRWAEYVTVIATGAFVPFEAFEMFRRVTPARASALLLNVAVVIYLVRSLRRQGYGASRESPGDRPPGRPDATVA